MHINQRTAKGLYMLFIIALSVGAIGMWTQNRNEKDVENKVKMAIQVKDRLQAKQGISWNVWFSMQQRMLLLKDLLEKDTLSAQDHKTLQEIDRELNKVLHEGN